MDKNRFLKHHRFHTTKAKQASWNHLLAEKNYLFLGGI
jgi:hypothetical protein